MTVLKIMKGKNRDITKVKYLKSALIAGLITGLVSQLYSIITNIFCFLGIVIIIGGGIFSSILLRRNNETRLRAGNGALVGMYSSIVAAFVFYIIQFFQIQKQFRESTSFITERIEGFGGEFSDLFFSPISDQFLLGLFAQIVIFMLFCIPGATIGIIIFGRQREFEFNISQEREFDPKSIHSYESIITKSDSEAKNFCSKCGTSIKSSDKFCSKCGAKLD